MRDGLVRNRLAIVAGLAAALPVIVSAIGAVSADWLPVGDNALFAIQAHDALSTHPPLVGPHSVLSDLIDEPVHSPGPLIFWLLAIPVRIGDAAPAAMMGLVNTAAIVGSVVLARRRGGTGFMFATAAALAVMCGSLDSWMLHNIWTPHAVVLPFTLLIFVAWSIACGDHRLLPLAALLASFTVQSHTTYAVPTLALAAVAVGFLVATRRRVPRAWLLATAAVLLVCWSLPIADEILHRPGNMERAARAAIADEPRFGGEAGSHSVARTVGVPPWWLRQPRGVQRLDDVWNAPGALTIASAVVVLIALAAVAVIALRRRRTELAAGALIALLLSVSVGIVTASVPSEGGLVLLIGYAIWWAAPAGMFAWLILGLAAAPVLARAPLPRPRSAWAAAAGVVVVAALGTLVAARGKTDPVERTYGPMRSVVDGVRDAAPRDGTVLVTGPPALYFDAHAAVTYALRSDGVRFVSSGLFGLGDSYDPQQHRHTAVIEIAEASRPRPPGTRVIARARLREISASPPPEAAERMVEVRLGPALDSPIPGD